MDTPSSRIEVLDLAKGIAVLLMILGHAELFLNRNAYFPLAVQDGEYLTIDRLYNFILYIFQSSVDAFYFFAGVGVAYAVSRAERPSMVRKMLWKRAWFLIVLDLTVISWTYGKGPLNWQIVFGSIGVFGISFMLLSMILEIKSRYLVAIAGSLLIGRELLIIEEPFDPETLSALFYGIFWAPLETESWSSFFTVMSWLPIVLLGYCFGRELIIRPKLLTAKTALITSGVLLALFGIFRLYFPFGSLGQPLPRTWVQVFQLDKYPASLHFHLLNGAFVFFYCFLAAQAISRGKLGRLRSGCMLLGRQMLFVYVMHLVLLAVLRFLQIGVFERYPNLSTYLGFVAVLSLLFPMTQAYDRLKRQYRKRFWLFAYL